MITSALIAQCRRDSNDIPRSTRMARTGDGTTNLFNVGRTPIVENSYSVYKGTSAQTNISDYTLDLDNGDLQYATAPGSGVDAIAEFKYANWRDANWNEAINDGIQELNARGFFRQYTRVAQTISAGVRTFAAPSACVDLYELLYSPASGTYSRPDVNWSYQEDANKVVLGGAPTTTLSASISYLRNMQTYTATSATLDAKDTWVPLIKKYAQYKYFEYMAGKIATQGNASIDEGHFSFSNARAQANSLFNEFSIGAQRAKPTRPAKAIGYAIMGGGNA